MKEPRVFIAGPMTGIPHFNQNAFNMAAAFLRLRGWLVHNPVEADVAIYGNKLFASNGAGSIDQAVEAFQYDYQKSLMDGLQVLGRDCTAIYLLDGWLNSKGAWAEYTVARALRLHVIQEGWYHAAWDDPPLPGPEVNKVKDGSIGYATGHGPGDPPRPA